MPKLGPLYLLSLCVQPGWCEQFAIQVASPVAAQSFHAKTSTFVFRTVGCAEPAKAEISVTAEGMMQNQRRSQRLQRIMSTSPGVYAVFREWPSEGVWILNIAARCGAEQAGALVAVGPKGLEREQSRFFPQPASEGEIDRLLRQRAAAK